jgi:hypothetical protein
MRNPNNLLGKNVLQNGNNKQANNSFNNLNQLIMSQSNIKIQKEIAANHSPKPQIRIRTDTFKSKPSNDLVKYEERL